MAEYSRWSGLDVCTTCSVAAKVPCRTVGRVFATARSRPHPGRPNLPGVVRRGTKPGQRIANPNGQVPRG